MRFNRPWTSLLVLAIETDNPEKVGTKVSIVLGRLSWYSRGDDIPDRVIAAMVSIVLGRLSWYSRGKCIPLWWKPDRFNRPWTSLLVLATRSHPCEEEIKVSIVLGRLSWYSLRMGHYPSMGEAVFQSSLDVSLGTRARLYRWR